MNKRSTDSWEIGVDHSMTFGDILTLVLAFFVLMVSLGELGIVDGAHAMLHGNRAAQLLKAELNEEGMILAESSGQELPIKGVWFDSADLESLLALTPDRWQWNLPEVFAVQDRVIIRACSRATSGSAWEISKQRGLRMRAVLTPVFKDMTKVGLEMLGPHCEQLGENLPEAAVVAVVKG